MLARADAGEGGAGELAADPREPLFQLGRCLAHLAVDPDYVYAATHLRWAETVFLPSNKGCKGGARNPVATSGFATEYLWKEAWLRLFEPHLTRGVAEE